MDSILDDAEGDEAVYPGHHGRRHPSQVLKKVEIPAPRSSLGSSLSSLRDDSSEGQTPATSVAVTPAEYLPKMSNKPCVASTPSVQVPIFKGKRKRTDQGEQTEVDELLAQSVQQREWETDISRRLTSKQQRIVLTSDDNKMPIVAECSEEDSSSGVDVAVVKRREIGRPCLPPLQQNYDNSRNFFGSDDNSNMSDSGDDETAELSDVSAFTLALDESEAFEDSEDGQINSDAASLAESIAAETEASDRALSVTAPQSLQRRDRPARPNSRPSRNRWRGIEDRATRERNKLELAHPELKSMWDDLKAVSRIIPSQASQPSTITRKLKSFQLEGLDWMIKQERSQWKGGLLGDEMGMGKTIQAVSLIMSDYPAQDPTLVVVPPVALMQWQNEIEQYTDGKLKVLVFHNTNHKVKSLKIKDLRAFDVIMISYSGLESTYRKESKGWKRDDGLVKENSKIHAIHYHRLILDEAHNIKTRTTSVAKACFALKANFKWCLSGTPVQNRIGEFFSLLRFLQVRPFASYFCKKCPCAELHWIQDMNKRCTNCHHTGFEHVSIFNQELLNPITQQGDPELRREALKKLRLVTDRIMLRRMKRDYTTSMELPPKEVLLHNEFFGEIERDFSSSIMSNTTRQFDTYVSRGVMLNNYANIFGLIMQVCNIKKLISCLPSVNPVIFLCLDAHLVPHRCAKSLIIRTSF